MRKVKRNDLCCYIYSSCWVENTLEKIAGYCSSTDKNSAALGKTGVMEIEKKGRMDGEIEEEESNRKEAFLNLSNK